MLSCCSALLQSTVYSLDTLESGAWGIKRDTARLSSQLLHLCLLFLNTQSILILAHLLIDSVLFGLGSIAIRLALRTARTTSLIVATLLVPLLQSCRTGSWESVHEDLSFATLNLEGLCCYWWAWPYLSMWLAAQVGKRSRQSRQGWWANVRCELKDPSWN